MTIRDARAALDAAKLRLQEAQDAYDAAINDALVWSFGPVAKPGPRRTWHAADWSMTVWFDHDVQMWRGRVATRKHARGASRAINSAPNEWPRAVVVELMGELDRIAPGQVGTFTPAPV